MTVVLISLFPFIKFSDILWCLQNYIMAKYKAQATEKISAKALKECGPLVQIPGAPMNPGLKINI